MKQSLHPKSVWIFFFQGIFRFLFIFCIFFFYLGAFFISSVEDPNYALKFFPVYPFLFLIFTFIFFFFWAKLSYRFWKYEITEDAVRIERGVIWKKYISIPYERIQNIDIYRGVLARILGLSTLNIQTAGYSGSGRHGGPGSEGNIPGISVDIAEQLRDDLIKKAKGSKQGI